MSTVTVWHPGVVLKPIDLTSAIIMAVKAELTPAQTMALTAWAEARSRFENGRWVINPIDAMADIVNVVENRAQDTRWRSSGHKGVCLAKWQFSCWEPGGGQENFESVMYAAQKMLAGVLPTGRLRDCLALAEGCLAGSMVDTLSGATHYVADWLTPRPAWARHPLAREVARRWGHVFFAGVP